MSKSPELHALIFDLWTELHNVSVLWQAAVVGTSLLAAWWMGRLMRAHLPDKDGRLAVGIGGVRRLQFPLSALFLVLIGRAALKKWQTVHALDVVVALLVSLAIIRIVIYALHLLFAPSGWRNAVTRAVGSVVWIGFAVYVSGLAPDLLRFLDSIGFAVGQQHISLLLVLQGTLSVLFTLLLALLVGRFLETRLMQATSLDINLRVMFSKLVQALLVVVAILIVLPAVGIDLTVLSVFGGMLGVGIGFGLQKIASNYISGFIILMDRSVGIGDLITVDNHTGQLTKMTARYVVVRSLTGIEAIIPNETIITSTVINHSYTDPRVRIALPVEISYQSDVDIAMRIMEDAARRQSRVLKDPSPGALLLRFADSGIDLELGIWIEDPEQGTLALRSDIYCEIWREFKKHRIEIPYPQREVRILSGDPAPQQSR